ncbi:GNAT family N-acetyltransferase [Oceanobacillus halotolerans]|uniref:GNAT family N-acetyltransferase n=1 Tax=Oceanobacillus halotolerans TaxID=2663380 RepID=UPI001CF78FC9|nr:GNAT family N-acetyltransferase [Oceanobacillus halotolerans]
MNGIQSLHTSDYDEIFALSQYAFQYELTERELEKKKQEAWRHKIWGYRLDGQLAAKLHLIPLPCYVNGKVVQMGGISSVATWPEYRRQGMVKDLLFHALSFMKENGQLLSFLHPFSFSFYRQYGWAYTFNEKQYTIPMGALKKKWHATGYVQRTKDLDILQELYTAYAQHYNGMLVRDEKWWEQRVFRHKRHAVVAYNEQKEAVGYLLYTVKDNIFTVHEIIYHNVNARKLLVTFIANHDSMAKEVKLIAPENDNLALLVDEPRFEQTIKPYFMARIVDVLAFLKQYRFEGTLEQSIVLQVSDPFFPENEGTYYINGLDQSGVINVTHGRQLSTKSSIHCSIQMLTAMLLGFKRPTELLNLGLISGDRRQVEALDKHIPNRQTFLSDFF